MPGGSGAVVDDDLLVVEHRQSLGGDEVWPGYIAPNPTEENAFFGLALLGLAVVILIWLWRSPVVKALAQGFGGKIKDALTTALKLAPSHADSHIAYGAYQAEVVNKVGGLVAGMTYGAKKDSALEHFQKALKLNPDSAIARIEYANGLILLFGKDKIEEATKLYEQAAKCKPMDAMERLDVEMARSELE